MDKTEKRICLYASVLITVMLSSPKLLALRENGIIAQFWRFNLAEWGLQGIFNFIFCYVFLSLNLNKGFGVYRDQKKWTRYVLYNLALGYVFVGIGILCDYLFFQDPHANRLYVGGYQIRFAISGILVGILVKIILLMREAKLTQQENERLKSAYMVAELELLKGQLNPHFLFNSLSSLSGVVKENPTLAQHYIKHLSKVFRYALAQSGSSLVTVDEELTMLASYAELLTMRFEKAFALTVDVDSKYLHCKIPHLSLQPLLENAAKHNSVTLKKPLNVRIYVEDGFLTVSNNLQLAPLEGSTGIGLANLSERFRILMHSHIEIIKTPTCFNVKLPLAL